MADIRFRPSYSADWGDYISFAHRMREKADAKGVDLLLIDTGDRIEGNGLYDASDPKGVYTREIFKEQPIDIICSGNHELYQKNSSNNEYLYVVPEFKDNYLASNLDIFDPRTGDVVPLAPRFKKFTTKNQGIRILAFGFLFDFTGNYNNTIVQPVEKAILEDWFQKAIRDREVDLFLVTGHVAIDSEEYKNIYKAIRSVQWDVSIQFFGGHSHVRDYRKYDSKAYALESGRYMETIGFQSISGLSTGNKLGTASSLTYARRYIDNNLFSYYHHTSLNSTTFPTSRGRNVSSLIASARKDLRLDHRFGCAPINFWTNRVSYPSNNSIFSLLEQLVLPDMVLDEARRDKPRIVIANTGAMRFDIFKGPFTIDTTFTVSPFASGFRYIKDVPFAIADRMLGMLNNQGEILSETSPELKAWMLTPPEQMSIPADIIIAPPKLSSALRVMNSAQHPLSPTKDDNETPLTPGYTTKDDAGTDGDDTIHSPVSFYRVPNCIEARIGFDPPNNNIPPSPSLLDKPSTLKKPETVDLVYLEFIQPWILLASFFLGSEFKVTDTEAYMEGKDFTGMIARWVEENWKGDC